MSALVVIARHGDTFAPGEPPRRVGARTDIPLVASGRAQASRLGAAFADAGLRFDRVLCSPLRRTRETAALVLDHAAAAAPPETADWLAEVDHGPDEDQAEDAVEARIGRAALDAWERDAVPPPGWTVDADTRQAAWRDFLDGWTTGTALLVTSNGAARFALLALGDRIAPPASLKLRTGAYGLVRRDGDAMRLEGWNIRP